MGEPAAQRAAVPPVRRVVDDADLRVDARQFVEDRRRPVPAAVVSGVRREAASTAVTTMLAMVPASL